MDHNTQKVIDQIFASARTHNGWLAKPVPDSLLQEIYEVAKWGPTSTNSNPARIVFVKSAEAKAKLLPCLLPGNVDKTKEAPVTAIIAQDLAFPDTLGKLFPHADARSWFAGNEALIESTALRNSSLQGAYFMLAARAAGLDCGPMSGFDQSKVDQTFFPGSSWRSNFICNLGYGDASKLYPRLPRLSFDEACRIV
jgi:3-hydroxypropanoate dehydrogenase